MEEEVLGAEHQRGHRLDLGGSGPFPEVLDRDAEGRLRPICGASRAADVIADVEQREALRAQILDGVVRVPRAAEELAGPVQIASVDQQLDVPDGLKVGDG